MHPCLFMSGLLLVLSTASSAQAQVTVDVTKITCDQYVHSKIASPRMIAAWLSGYYNAKLDNQVIDLQTFEANSEEVGKILLSGEEFQSPCLASRREGYRPGQEIIKNTAETGRCHRT